MENEKLLTISIAAFNVEKYLRVSLDSLLIGNDLQKLEVFIIDDGGTDSSLNIAREYEERYPGVFYAVHKEDEGYGSTVNYSIAHAHGKYIRLLDGDDWFDKEGLISFIKKLEYTDADMLITRFNRVNEITHDIQTIDETRIIPNMKCQFDDLVQEGWFTMHAITYKTAILQKNNIRLTENCFYADSEYNLLPLKYIKDVQGFEEVVYNYRLGLAEQSVSIKGIERHHSEQLKILKRLYVEYSGISEKSENRNKYVFRYLIKWSNALVYNLLLIEKSKDHKREIINYFRYIKLNHRNIYDALKRKSKLSKILIYTKYSLYSIMHFIIIIRSKNNGYQT